MRCRAGDIYALLACEGCAFTGESSLNGEVWATVSGQVFVIPKPFVAEGDAWLTAEVIQDILRDRWVGFTLPATLRRYQ